MPIKTMPIKMIVLSLVVVLAIAGAVAAVPLTGGNDGENQDSATREAEGYAAHHGVSLDEAQNRFALQKLAGDLNATLSAREGQTFGGLWIEHTPEFRVVVQFTRDAQETTDRYVQSNELTGVLEVRTAALSLNDLQEAQSTAMEAISGESIPAESGIDIKTGRIQVYVAERGRLDSAIQRDDVSLPGTVDLITVPELSHLEADIYGGLALTTCTSGFSVKKSDGTKGITTAGHCGNSQAYDGTDLDFEEEKEETNYDIQWHTAPDFTVTNKIQTASNGGTRSVTGTVGRSSQSVGDYVCKYGKTSGYTCGYISDKNFWPEGHSPTFIRVDNTAGDDDLSSGGDSGGPWFLVYDAYGTHVGAPSSDLNDAIYMAVNYISPGIGVDVMTSP